MTVTQLEFEASGLVEPISAGAAAREGVPVPPKRLSPSGASTFESCPRRWRYRYVERLPDPPGVHALVGSFAHRVLELLMQKAPILRTIDEAKRIARSEWPNLAQTDDFRDLELDDGEARQFRWKSWQAIEGLWCLEDPTEVEVEATEEDMSVMLGDVPFRGVVDRLEREHDGLVVSDYKSGRAPSARYSQARLQQVLLYAAAVREQMGEAPVRAQLLYLGQRIVGTTTGRAEMDAAVDQLTQTWGEIVDACESDEFETRTGPLCAYCAYLEHCADGQQETARRAAERAAQEESLLRLAG